MNQTPLTVQVTRRRAEAADIATFELADPAGGVLPSFSAGSHIDVQVPNGPVRQYSLCNDPTESHRYLIGVLRVADSRGGSAGMHAHVREGDTLRISAPKNHFPLAHGGSHSLLVAGGIGVTPILCMAERLANASAAFAMHYCTRSRERTAFLGRIQSSRFADRVAFHFDDGSDEQKFSAERVLVDPAPEAHLYLCGPTAFMDFVIATARRTGWSESRIHREYFSAQPQAITADAPFAVRLASSGKTISIPSGISVVDALADAGVEILTSCREGVCGTCITRVLEGEPDHRDVYFTEEEHARNDQFTPCCSRSKSPVLVLDL